MKRAFYEKFVDPTAVQAGDVAQPKARALPDTAVRAGFYQAALLPDGEQAPEQGLAAEQGDRVVQAVGKAEAPVRVDALEAGTAVSEPAPVLLASNHTKVVPPATSPAPVKPAAPAASKTAKAQDEDDGLGWGYIVPLLLVGAAAASGSKDGAQRSAPETEKDTCTIDIPFPDRPSAATAQTIAVAFNEERVQASGDTYLVSGNNSLIVTLGVNGELSGETGAFYVTASGDMGQIYVSAGPDASTRLNVQVDGGISGVAARFGNDTRGQGQVIVNANGDVGSVDYLASGYLAGTDLSVETIGGDVGAVNVTFANPDGWADVNVSAFAENAEGTLVGGNVGNVTVLFEGLMARGSAHVEAFGGNVGKVLAVACGESGSGGVYISAIAQIDGNGRAVGGNVGDISLLLDGGSGDVGISVYAQAAISDEGVYLGGGQIGNVLVEAVGSETEADVSLRLYRGGSIGTITMKVSREGDQAYSASATVRVDAYGSGGQVVTIGDVTVDIYEGFENAASLNLDAREGGNVGSITVNVHGGGSADTDIYVSALANADGSGGSIGNVTLTDTSWGGDHEWSLKADTSMGDITAALGGGSANMRMTLVAGEGASVGDIAVVLDAEHYGSGGTIAMGFGAGATVGTVSVTGGSELSTFNVQANGLNGYGWNLGEDSAVIGDVDMAGFAGFSTIDLHTVTNTVVLEDDTVVNNGVRINVGQGGSLVHGTQADDDIFLGAGADTVSFDHFTGGSSKADSIAQFDLALDRLDFVVNGSDYVELTANPGAGSELVLTANQVITLVDIDSTADDITTVEGLLAALGDGGEYEHVDGSDGGSYIFATASGTGATSFNVFNVTYTTAGGFDAHLMASVDLKAGATFAGLSASNFSVVPV